MKENDLQVKKVGCKTFTTQRQKAKNRTRGFHKNITLALCSYLTNPKALLSLQKIIVHLVTKKASNQWINLLQ